MDAPLPLPRNTKQALGSNHFGRWNMTQADSVGTYVMYDALGSNCTIAVLYTTLKAAAERVLYGDVPRPPLWVGHGK